MDVEHKSMQLFINALHKQGHKFLADGLNEGLNDLDWEELRQLVANSRELSQTPAFVQAREMNDGLLAIKNQVVQQWEDLELGLDDENP